MSLAEQAVEELVTLLEPLEVEAVEAVVELVKLFKAHPDGVALAAKRTAEALASEAAIRS